MADIRARGPFRSAIDSAQLPEKETALRWKRATSVVAFVLLVLLGMRQEINQLLTLGDVAALALCPVWLFSLRFYRRARSVIALGAIALVMGVFLSGFSALDHQLDRVSYFNNAVTLCFLLLSIGAVLWARTLMPDWLVGLGFGAGLFLGVSGTGRAAENLWKFGYAIPSIILVLSLVSYASRRWDRGQRFMEMSALLGLALLSGLNDARSLFGMLMLTLVTVIWQLIPRGKTLRRGAAKTLLLFASMILVVYNLGTSLLVEGYLGANAKDRSIEQISLTGSLLLGARPEMAATAALFQSQPWGFGLGITPSLDDIMVAKTGMAGLHYEPNNGYVEKYMFGKFFELHSVIGDMWVLFGIGGAILALVILTLVIRWIGTSVARRQASGLVLFLAIFTLWNMCFSPMYPSVPTMALAVGLILSRRSEAQGRPVSGGSAAASRGFVLSMDGNLPK
ncbi:hypothetical protein SAMN04487916_10658 [Arthrobacter sp. ov407]|uniref:hypothetical protein n=1 Tax=Arthrobacter sp. ov407 TaxID=1761748 RepID=UPI000882B75D|nr:hypothetical protein [Arthrobacter sp. ov407]SDL13977.1 hypothetical protein SAMN04487916_10658 [Arthrobacter sp. ov407]